MYALPLHVPMNSPKQQAIDLATWLRQLMNLEQQAKADAAKKVLQDDNSSPEAQLDAICAITAVIEEIRHE